MKFVSMIALLLAVTACSSGSSHDESDSKDTPKEELPGTPSSPSKVNPPRPYTVSEVCNNLPESAGWNEDSGIAYSPATKRLYMIADSGNRPQVYVMDMKCNKLGVIKVDGENEDWEAIAWHNGTLYVADIGDNDDSRDDVRVYSFAEPTDPNASVKPHWEDYRYTTGAINSESLFVNDGGVFSVSKNYDHKAAVVFKLEAGKGTPVLELPAVTYPVGDTSWTDGKMVLANDDAGEFSVCSWDKSCWTIKAPFLGQHEAVQWISADEFIYASEDSTKLMKVTLATSNEVKTPSDTSNEVEPKPEIPHAGPWKVPEAMWPYQIMDEDDGDYVKQLKSDTKLVNIELFGADAKRIQALHERGQYVVCYYSLSYEDWRPDAKQFPAEAKGKKMSGWSELWSNISLESLHRFMDKRDDLAKSIGCDATEKDNSDDGEKAFKLTKSQLVWSSKRRADYAHSIGLGSMFKNTPDIAAEASVHNDGVFIEECRKYNECDAYKPWAGKSVNMVEYSKSNARCLPWAVVNFQNGSYFKANYGACK